MKTSQFKTSIKCSGCLAQVTPFLNSAVGENTWEVDITDPAKVLTVTGEMDADKIVEAVQKAGFKAEKI